MGEPDVARVDVAALRDIARQYDTVAEIVDDAVRSHLTGLAFDGAVAGRGHVAGGGRVGGARAWTGLGGWLPGLCRPPGSRRPWGIPGIATPKPIPAPPEGSDERVAE